MPTSIVGHSVNNPCFFSWQREASISILHTNNNNNNSNKNHGFWNQWCLQAYAHHALLFDKLGADKMAKYSHWFVLLIKIAKSFCYNSSFFVLLMQVMPVKWHGYYPTIEEKMLLHLPYSGYLQILNYKSIAILISDLLSTRYLLTKYLKQFFPQACNWSMHQSKVNHFILFQDWSKHRLQP